MPAYYFFDAEENSEALQRAREDRLVVAQSKSNDQSKPVVRRRPYGSGSDGVSA